MMRRLAGLLCLFALAVGPVGAQPKLIFGVVPQQSPLKLYQNWQPVAEHLSEVTGREVVFETEKSIAEFETQLAKGRYDLAYMNPYHYVVAHEQQGYQARFRRAGKIRGILVSTRTAFNPEEPITRPVLFPSPNAFAATLLIKYELLAKQGVSLEYRNLVKYVNSHDSVYKGVARGVSDFGGGVERTFRTFDEGADKGKLHIVYRTDPYPSHPIAYHPRLAPSLQARFDQAWQTLPSSVMENLGFKRLLTVGDANYDSIRALRRHLSTAPIK
ncbi:phosphate/phosphite/phosphonate ABC transporter substrate-binding protein [Thiomicrospira sp. WB1]|uniref:phosphate/phosphite/phosphonate ABC transporter substrate-binding protein n=1 Tax=Thiomicrospira sp. WB1 TaxID=1685380 RepID=UPI00074A515D|nr:phosphate/phosphite/phosphonate ABC transporter substrate-binding protein [Thiomicrospira sp. WB1]KUJ72785.1 hypothetical protein AVO41_03105 [Thiomicrospira sp. WB1]